jgi:hypothetical protein
MRARGGLGRAYRRRCRHANEHRIRTRGGVDREELERQIPNMYREPPPPNRRPLAQGLGHPNDLPTRLPPQAVNSFAGVDYHLSLARLLQGERVVELGCGSGMDVLADATQVGPAGAVTACRHHNQSSSPKQSACAAVTTRASCGHGSRNCHSTTAGRRRDSKRRGQLLGGQAPGIRRCGPVAPAEWTARASRHRDSATDRDPHRASGRALGCVYCWRHPRRSLPRKHREPLAATCKRSRPIPPTDSRANERSAQAASTRRTACRAQARVWIHQPNNHREISK